MSEHRRPVSVSELHAYVDNQLDPARRAEVEAHLAAQPADAERVKDYRKINDELHALFDPVLEEPLPPYEVPQQPWHRRRFPYQGPLLHVAAAVAWLALGSIVGWVARGPSVSEPPPLADLAPFAASAYAVYTPEVRHPVEVPASEQQHLVAWLSKRLGEPLRVPDLKPMGYELVGGRLLAAEGRPAAFFLYQDGTGRRLSLVVRRDAWENRETVFHQAQEGRVRVFYWIDGPFGYALAGELPQDEMSRVAREVYHQLTS